MGKRRRRRAEPDAGAASTSDYTDADGNVLTLRDTLSARTIEKVRAADARAAASAEDVWQRRSEMLFERLAVRWVIADLPLSDQRELLGRYRLADEETRRWVRQAIDEHMQARGISI